MSIDMADLTCGHFLSAVDQVFEVEPVEGAGSSIGLTLREASPIARSHTLRSESFSLIFESALSNALEQGTYLFDHPCIGRQAIFIVPVSDSGDIRRYQAIFN